LDALLAKPSPHPTPPHPYLPFLPPLKTRIRSILCCKIPPFRLWPLFMCFLNRAHIFTHTDWQTDTQANKVVEMFIRWESGQIVYRILMSFFSASSTSFLKKKSHFRVLANLIWKIFLSKFITLCGTTRGSFGYVERGEVCLTNEWVLKTQWFSCTEKNNFDH